MLSVLLTTVFAVNAQRVSFGVRGGLNVSSVSVSLEEMKGISPEVDYGMGMHVGGIVDISLEDVLSGFYVQPGLYYSLNRSKVKGSEGDEKNKFHYFKLPLLLSYRFPLLEEVRLHFNLGPYFAYGFSGEISVNGVVMDAFKEFRANGKKDVKLLKRFDTGIAFGTGVNIDRVYVGLGYEIGIFNTANISKFTYKNRNFFLSFGYDF